MTESYSPRSHPVNASGQQARPDPAGVNEADRTQTWVALLRQRIAICITVPSHWRAPAALIGAGASLQRHQASPPRCAGEKRGGAYLSGLDEADVLAYLA